MREHVPDHTFAQEPVGFDIGKESRIVPGKRTRTLLLPPPRNAPTAATQAQAERPRPEDEAQEVELASDAGGVLDRCGGWDDDPFWFAEGTDEPARAAIVDGEVVRPGQMTKHEFLAELRSAVERTGRDPSPEIAAFFERQARRPAAQVEALMRRHAGKRREDARDYIEPVRERLVSDAAG
jgi:hypothetical protein